MGSHAQNKIRHHYVPAGLSKNFCSDGRRLYLYDLHEQKIIASSPKDAFVEKNLHSLVKEGGEVDHNLVEDSFMEIEGNGLNAIRKIIENGKIFADDIDWMATFVALQYVRTPTARKDTEELLKQSILATAMSLDSSSALGEIPAALKKYGENLSDLIRNGHVLAEITLPQVTMSGIAALPEIHALLMQMNWCLLKAPENKYFFLSDHPCAILNPDFRTTGLGVASTWDAELTMPISKNLCLLASLKNLPTTKTLNEEQVTNINKRTAVFGERFFAHPLHSPEELQFLIPYKQCSREIISRRVTSKNGYAISFEGKITGSKSHLYRKIPLLF